MTEISGKRINYIDAIKGIGILEVVLGHITALGNPVDRWMSTHKLAIFFIVSGWLMCYKGGTGKSSFGEFVKKKFYSLLVPYLCFSGITIFYKVMVQIFKEKSTHDILINIIKNLYLTFSGRGIGALWFLTAMFVAEMIFFWVLRLGKAGRALSLFFAFAISLAASSGLGWMAANLNENRFDVISMPILAISKGIVGFFFMYCGYLSFEYMQRVKKILGGGIYLGIGVVLFCVNSIISHIVKGSIDLNNMYLSDTPVLFFVGGIIGSLGWILIFETLEKYSTYPILGWCGRNSLIIMATHGVLGFKTIFVKGWAATVSLSQDVCLKYYVECLMILIHLMIFEYGIVEFVNKKLPFLTGKRRKK